MQLTDQVALVTGAGHGIGRTIATRLAREGASVAVNYLDDEAEAAQVVAEITSFGGGAIAVQCDVSETSQRHAMFALIKERFHRLDILVNNAALDPGGTDFLDVNEDLYDRVLDISLKGAYFCAQSAVRLMLECSGGGRIINISSVQGVQNLPRLSPYSLTKGGINAMTRQLALDLAPHQITVNAVAPGFIEVERTIQGHPGYTREKIAQRIPIGRVGFPSDVAALVAFLASPESGYITGDIITCDGGKCARLSL